MSIEAAFAIAKRELAAENRDWRVTIDHYTSGRRCFAGLAVVDASIAPSHGVLEIITQEQTHSRFSLAHG